MKRILTILSISLSIQFVNGQDSLLLPHAAGNMTTMSFNAGEFRGEGWDIIKERAQNSQHVLIGEDHFTKEIPELISAIGLDSPFDNFYIEIDPYTTSLLAQSFEWSEEKRNEFNDKYGQIFSFYTLREEYQLLQKMVRADMKLLGSDQIVMYDDRLLFDDLATKTKNTEARSIYEFISKKSEEQFQKFLQDPGNNMMYMMTDDFSKQIEKLEALELSGIELEIIEKMKISRNIYSIGSHTKRVQLLKHHFMNDYENWNGKRNLFKYGANHMARGESFLTVTDIGNLVANIAEANYEKSLHVMVLGESGMQASAFETFPTSPIDPNGFYLKHLQLFFQLTEGDDWAVFDLVPIRKELERGRLKLENENLIRTIKGFDILVLIPEVTAATF